jgi:hypothetical protein
MEIPVQQFPILTPGQMSPFNQALTSGLEMYGKTNKALYDPMKMKAEAASKMAYANLMGPQFLAKAMGNENLLANLTENQKTQGLNTIYQAGSGQAQNGSLMNSLTDWYKKTFKNSSSIPVQQSNEPAPSEPSAPQGDQTQEAIQAWLKSKEASDQIAQQGQATIPPADKLLAWYQNQEAQQQGAPNVPASAPAAPRPQSFNQDQPLGETRPRTFAENSGDFKSIVAEGKEAGVLRAKDIQELNTDAYNGRSLQTTSDYMMGLVTSPTFNAMRQVPLMGQHELGWYQKFGNKQEKDIAGKFLGGQGKLVSDYVKTFGGRALATEIELAKSVKVNESDMPEVAAGKMKAMDYLTKMVTQRADLTAQYMKEYHYNKGEAEKLADKQVNGEKIRADIEDRWSPEITVKNKKTGETKKLKPSEARKLGVSDV